MDRKVWFNVPVCYLVSILNTIIDWASSLQSTLDSSMQTIYTLIPQALTRADC